jgi:hypothetical protein
MHQEYSKRTHNNFSEQSDDYAPSMQTHTAGEAAARLANL